MRCQREHMLLYAVTDQAWTGEQTLLEQIEEALKGGITCLQLREKGMGEAEFLEEARQAQRLCQKYGVPFIVNDNVEVAMACGADGVHVGQEDLSVAKVRELAGNTLWVGVSAHSIEEALEAERQGADYLGVGCMFPTETKQNVTATDFQTLRSVCEAVKIPVVAIGGIQESNIGELKGLGMDGVAVVSAIFGAGRIGEACRRLRRLSAEAIS